MWKDLIVIVFTTFAVSCHDDKNLLLRSQKIANLAMDVPKSFKFIEGRGIDSYVAYLVNGNNDTFHIEYGSRGIVSNLYEIGPPIFSIKSKPQITMQAGREPDAEEVVFSEYPEEDEGQKIFDKNYYMYDTINNIIVKIVQPKRIGNGITGLYVPTLKDGNSFSIYANNLDSLTHKEAIAMFRTIRYNKVAPS